MKYLRSTLTTNDGKHHKFKSLCPSTVNKLNPKKLMIGDYYYHHIICQIQKIFRTTNTLNSTFQTITIPITNKSLRPRLMNYKPIPNKMNQRKNPLTFSHLRITLSRIINNYMKKKSKKQQNSPNNQKLKESNSKR